MFAFQSDCRVPPRIDCARKVSQEPPDSLSPPMSEQIGVDLSIQADIGGDTDLGTLPDNQPTTPQSDTVQLPEYVPKFRQ